MSDGRHKGGKLDRGLGLCVTEWPTSQGDQVVARVKTSGSRSLDALGRLEIGILVAN